MALLRSASLSDLGPVIRATVGDTIKVVFKNNTPFPATMHPHGVRYNPEYDGVYLGDFTRAGGFIAFVILLAILEQIGVPNRILGYLFVFFTIAVTLSPRVQLKDAAFGALVAAFPNTGFMGVPLLVALLFPPDGHSVLFKQPGNVFLFRFYSE